MKKAKGEPTINTIPEGVYESGISNQGLRDGTYSAEEGCCQDRITTDLQGNGYPNPHCRRER